MSVEDRKCIKLLGKVVSGIGEGAYYVNIYRNVFNEVLGINPYPGTLNIDVGEDIRELWFKLNPLIIKPRRKDLSIVYVLPGFVNNIRGYAIKPLKTIHQWNIIEFISSENIRSKLGISDGDTVEVLLCSFNNNNY